MREAIEAHLGEAHEMLEEGRDDKARDLFAKAVEGAEAEGAVDLLREAAWHLAVTCFEQQRYKDMIKALAVLVPPSVLPIDLPANEDPVDLPELCAMTQLYWDRYGYAPSCLDTLWQARAEQFAHEPASEDVRLPLAMLAWLATCHGERERLQALLAQAEATPQDEWSGGDELLYSSLWTLGVWSEDAELALEGKACFDAYLRREAEEHGENQTYLLLESMSGFLFGWKFDTDLTTQLRSFTPLLADEYAALNDLQADAFDALACADWAESMRLLDEISAHVENHQLGQERSLEARLLAARVGTVANEPERRMAMFAEIEQLARRYDLQAFSR